MNGSMNQKIFSNMYWICDDNNAVNIIYLSGLVDIITSDSKEFSSNGSDIDYIMEGLDN